MWDNLASQAAEKRFETEAGRSPAMRRSIYVPHGKRILDFAVALVGLALSSPLLVVCALAIWLDSRRPIIYSQLRVGRGGKPFRIIKFRSMIQGADQQGLKLTASGDARITRVGRWLRKTKLDEVPQLVNVLRGEMSLVGPRPEVPKYVAAYNLEQRRVLDFRPGITGPASLAFIEEEQMLAGQVRQEEYYVSTILARKLELDLTYCDEVSFWTDLKLIFKTLGMLLRSARKNGAVSKA